MVARAKRRAGRRNGRKNRWCSKVRHHERCTQEYTQLIGLTLTEGKVFMADSHPAQKRGGGETEAGGVISVETEKRKVCWVRSGRMKRMTRASTQAKPSVGKTTGVFL